MIAQVKIKLHYFEHSNALGFNDIIVVEEIPDKDKQKQLFENDEVKVLTAYFREASWSEYNNDRGRFMAYNPHTNKYEVNVLDLVDFEFQKLLQYIEHDGTKTEMTPELTEELHPTIAGYLVEELSKKFITDQKELSELARLSSQFYGHKNNNTDLKYIPSEVMELELAEKFHWTLEDIRKISVKDMEKIILVMNQKSYEDQNAYGNAQRNNMGDDIVDEESGMRIIGGKHASTKMKDAIAHRIKK